MANVQQTMNKIRSKIRDIVGNEIVEERFFTWDRDTQQIVSNQKIGGRHFIFDYEGNLIKTHDD